LVVVVVVVFKVLPQALVAVVPLVVIVVLYLENPLVVVVRSVNANYRGGWFFWSW
jgi:hypothetical protein